MFCTFRRHQAQTPTEALFSIQVFLHRMEPMQMPGERWENFSGAFRSRHVATRVALPNEALPFLVYTFPRVFPFKLFHASVHARVTFYRALSLARERIATRGKKTPAMGELKPYRFASSYDARHLNSGFVIVEIEFARLMSEAFVILAALVVQYSDECRLLISALVEWRAKVALSLPCGFIISNLSRYRLILSFMTV